MSFKGLKNYKKTVEDKANKALHDVTEAAFENLVKGSPVDLGNFRSNWFGSARTPIVGDPKNYRKTAGSQGTVMSVRISNPGLRKGSPLSGLERTNLKPALQAKIGDTAYITNNLDYATTLENGGSPQAPAGILYVAAQKTRAEKGL